MLTAERSSFKLVSSGGKWENVVNHIQFKLKNQKSKLK